MKKYLFRLASLLGLALPAILRAADSPPNIVVIVADDLGYSDVSFNPQHAKEVHTPNLDALAKAGVICREGYTTAHVCSPTRAGLMTGRYQQRLGLYTAGEAGSGLPLGETIFPQFLKPAGYVSGAFGKWHLGLTSEYSPVSRGFDEFYGFLGRGGHDYFKLDDPASPIYRGLEPFKDKGYLTDRLGEEAASFIRRHKAQPFFVYLAFNAVHMPLQAPPDEIAKFHTGDETRDTILAMGKRLDDAIGVVTGTLKREGLWDNTIVFFISDNGGALKQRSENTPLRGGKHQDYEGGTHVPYVISWPAKIQGGRELQTPIITLDILPTVLAAAGLSAPKDKALDGVNLLPLLENGVTPPSRNLYWSSGSGDPWWGVRSGNWKLVGQKGSIELFDLSKDIPEQNDLAKELPEKVAELTRLHDAWLGEMADPAKSGIKKWTPGTPATAKEKKKLQRNAEAE